MGRTTVDTLGTTENLKIDQLVLKIVRTLTIGRAVGAPPLIDESTDEVLLTFNVNKNGIRKITLEKHAQRESVTIFDEEQGPMVDGFQIKEVDPAKVAQLIGTKVLIALAAARAIKEWRLSTTPEKLLFYLECKSGD